MNINQLMQMIKLSQNPQEFIYNMINERMGSNPFFANLINLAKEGKGNEIEAIAKNMMKEKGLDFDKEFNKFKQQMNI